TLKRGGWYRTVVHFPTAEEARGQVETIAAGSGRKPYVRALSEWCLDLARESEDVRRCAPPAAG
ncbi:hypothetical protein, partial [Caulobacter sp.]|uniref:hypothetical protein n=1 Tax=Caulobacter sp. TaxID=78 RepID=UPI001B08061C